MFIKHTFVFQDDKSSRMSLPQIVKKLRKVISIGRGIVPEVIDEGISTVLKTVLKFDYKAFKSVCPKEMGIKVRFLMSD